MGCSGQNGTGPGGFIVLWGRAGRRGEELELVHQLIAGPVQLLQPGLASWAMFGVLRHRFKFAASDAPQGKLPELICWWAKGL